MANTTGVGTCTLIAVLTVSSIDNIFAGAISSGAEMADGDNMDGIASTDTVLGSAGVGIWSVPWCK